MKAPDERTIKKLFALSRNRCAFPQCGLPIVEPSSGPITGVVCHISARKPGGPRYDPRLTDEGRNGFENLILLCSRHHKIVDDQPALYTIDLLREMKAIHERNGDVELTEEGARLARRLLESHLQIIASDDAQVMVSSPGGIQIKNLTIKTGRKRPPSIQPSDAVGANIEMRAYLEYLVKRYIDWRTAGIKSGKDKRPFHPSMTHQLVERTFGARTFLVSQTRFADLVDFLQSAIDDTITGRNRRRYGKRNYHSFQEHIDILHGRKDEDDQ